jgi:dihydroorotate dehydrogenase
MSVQQAVELGVEICGIRFPNPVLTAAGPPVRDGAAILACAAGGAGGLVTKTISRTAAAPTTPNMAEVSHGFLNAELWSELPPERWIEREYAIAREAGLPVVVSLGYTAEDVADLAPRVRPFADALELSTHYIGEDAAPMVAAIRAARAAVAVPVFVNSARSAERCGARRSRPRPPAPTRSWPSTRSGRASRSTSSRACPGWAARTATAGCPGRR